MTGKKSSRRSNQEDIPGANNGEARYLSRVGRAINFVLRMWKAVPISALGVCNAMCSPRWPVRSHSHHAALPC